MRVPADSSSPLCNIRTDAYTSYIIRPYAAMRLIDIRRYVGNYLLTRFMYKLSRFQVAERISGDDVKHRSILRGNDIQRLFTFDIT